MAYRNRKRRADGRKRKMITYESEPQLGSDDMSDLSRDDSYPPTDTHIPRSDLVVVEAQIQQLKNIQNEIEIKVELPISNSNSAQHLVASQTLLYRAALKGDWKAVSALILHRSIACMEVTERGDRMLHIAAAAKQTAFVSNLVEHLVPSELELRNIYGETAFYVAARSEVVEIANVMYTKNRHLPRIENNSGMTPLEMAIFLRNRKMVEYLYRITRFEDLNAKKYMEILAATIHIDMYDIALEILNAVDKSILTSTAKVGSVLQVLAQKPLSKNHGIQGRIWERLVSIITTIPYIPYFKRLYSSLQMRRQARQLVMELWGIILTLPISNILEIIRKTEIFHAAAKIGNVEFLTLLSHSYPDLIWNFDSERNSIFHIAVTNRQEEVFSLIYHRGVRKDAIALLEDNKGNNILHLAGKKAPRSRLNIVSGPALQMQRELQWFKAVEKIVGPSYLQTKNIHKQTPRKLFTLEHEKLREDGEKWMKKTATSCMVVATLIATVVFAAAFTVPGGYKQEKGTPIFLNDGWFTVFVTSDAVAMFTSTASILTFLSLFTAQYREDDFLFSLPTKLMVGLVTLFASIVCMVVTFSATFFLVYKEEKHGTLPKVVAALGLLPITLYAMLNLKLWIALIHSTFFASRFMFRPRHNRLF
ncbi:ankyrin repeat-containing At5g02620-like [Olea europaea subsp. europaea]|uniref:Ankyrin repeat-containing At5g02620-like n=1 Tax=Olea europaea subsp. europaea TaxID=158383 RepID=A0A8S0U1D5_OLEEU|nr:ankyrin repeat-containing At5g02620-like [Olea europaea subsp. europaea]